MAHGVQEEREVCRSVSQEAGAATGFGAGTGPRPGEGSAGFPGKRRSWKGREPRDPASALSQPGLLPEGPSAAWGGPSPLPPLPGLPVASPTRCAPTLPTLPLSLPQSSLCGVLGRRARQRELSAPDRGEGRLCPRSMGAGRKGGRPPTPIPTPTGAHTGRCLRPCPCAPGLQPQGPRENVPTVRVQEGPRVSQGRDSAPLGASQTRGGRGGAVRCGLRCKPSSSCSG